MNTSTFDASSYSRSSLPSIGAMLSSLLIAGSAHALEPAKVIPEAKDCKVIPERVNLEKPSKLSELISRVKQFALSIASSDARFHYYPLIVRDPTTGTIVNITLTRERRQKKVEEPITKGKKRTSTMKDVWPGNFVSSDTCGYSISLQPNGLNTRIIVTDISGRLYDVLGWVGHYKVGETVERKPYTPVTHLVTDPTLVAEGKERLEEYIEHAKSWIDEHHIKTSFGGDLLSLSYITPDDLIRTLVIIEKMDPTEYTSDDPKLWEGVMIGQIPRIYGRLGANRSDAFMSQVSSASACGISQYIGSSWKRVSDRLPSLGLGEFEVGCRDHETSLRAMYGHIEMELSEFQEFPRVIAWIQSDGKDYFPLILAMGYNSNPQNLARNLENILKGGKNMTPQEVMRLLLDKLPRKLKNKDNPNLGKQVSETLYYSLKFLYFYRQELGKKEPWIDEMYKSVIEAIHRQKKE